MQQQDAPPQRSYRTAAALLLPLVALLLGLRGPHRAGAAQEEDEARAEFVTTELGDVTLAWRPIPAPIPKNQPFELDVRLSRGGEPLPGARLLVRATMPGHGHGMLRAPKTEEVAPGRHRVRGMLFHMAGDWELELGVLVSGERRYERATFDVVPGRPLGADPLPLIPGPLTEGETRRALELSPLPPPPADPTNRYFEDERAARFGKTLFFDRRLSASGEVSCATCHDPERGWTDGRAVSAGLAAVDRNALPIAGAAHQRWFFWDGRADSLWAQSLIPIEDPREQGFTRVELVRLLAQAPELKEAYEAIFGPLPAVADAERLPSRGRPHPRNASHPEHAAWMSMAAEDRTAVDRAFANAGKAIAAFVRTIGPGRAPFDVFVEGVREGDADKAAALDESARRGLSMFLGRGRCHLCHSGPLFSDGEFHDTGIPPGPQGRKDDSGRYAGLMTVLLDPFNGKGGHSDSTEAGAVKLDFLARSGHDWGEFRTPSLRNVARTAPYMHHGQLATLEDVVRYYSTLEGALEPDHEGESVLQPLDLTDQEIADLVAFLEALTGE
ncbi:MAG: cytochrome c peroxidase [Planctomycetota bacterium]